MQQLSEQEIVRREALQSLRDLGVNPFPAEMFDVNFKSTDFTSEQFQKQLTKEIEKIKDIGPVKAEQIKEVLLQNKFRVAQILELEAFQAFGLTEQIEFDAAVNRDAESLEDFLNNLRNAALGDFAPESFPVVRVAGRFMGKRGAFAQLQDSEGRIQVYLGKGKIGESEEEQERTKSIIKLLHIGDFIGLEGELFSTQTGEVTIRPKVFKFLGKSIRNLPVV